MGVMVLSWVSGFGFVCVCVCVCFFLFSPLGGFCGGYFLRWLLLVVGLVVFLMGFGGGF